MKVFGTRWTKGIAWMLIIMMMVGLLPLSAVADDDPIPADTQTEAAQDEGTFCGKKEHTHDASCYERTQICALEETEGHTHTEECYAEETVLLCEQEETAPHTHTEECYNEEGELVCGLEETEGHTHTETCYATVTTLICGQEECEPHEHTDACYADVLVCGQEEHTHSLACYSDPTADVEPASVWAASVAGATLTGDWAHDVIAVAKTQLGYRESSKNYIIDEGVKKGYTRYGDWYGGEDFRCGNWCAGFVSFCLYYAGVEGVPESFACASWVDSLTKAGLYRDASAYTPKSGDIIFFDINREDERVSDHVGLVYQVSGDSLVTIEGNRTDTVETFSYSLDDASIVGYGALPENPNRTAQEEPEDLIPEDVGTTLVATDGETYRITVSYDETAGIPMEGAALKVTEIDPDSEAYAFYRDESVRLNDTDTDHLGLYRPFDIKIVSASEPSVVYEPVGAVNVSIHLLGTDLTKYVDVFVDHFAEQATRGVPGGTQSVTATPVDAAVSEDAISFTTDSFSVYDVGGTVHVRTYYFWTYNEYHDYVEYYLENGTDKPANFQIIRSGEELVLPQTPTDPQDPEATFSGWYERIGGDQITPSFAPDRYSFGVITFDDPIDTVIHLHARFSDYKYVIFHDQYDSASDSYPIAFTRRVNTLSSDIDEVKIDVTQFSVAYKDPDNIDDNKMRFVGWSATPIKNAGDAEDIYGRQVQEVETDNGKIWVTSTFHLYPIFKSVKWISFYSGPSGSGATFIADTAYNDGIGPQNLPGLTMVNGYAPMKRDGKYTFAGWYVGPTDADLNNGELPSDYATRFTKIANANGELIANASGTGVTVVPSVGTAGQEGYVPAYLSLTGNIKLYAAWSDTAAGTYKIVVVRLKKQADVMQLDPEDRYVLTEEYIVHGDVGASVNTTTEPTFLACKQFDDIDAYNDFHGTNLQASYYPYTGYTYSGYAFKNSVDTIAADNSTVLFVYYDWDTTGDVPPEYEADFLLTFEPNIPTGYTAQRMPTATAARNGDSLDALAPTTEGQQPVCSIPDAYTFSGWFMDENCTTPVFFHTPSAAELEPYKIYDLWDPTQNKYVFNGHYEYYAVMKTMPAANMTFYAGWNPAWYIVNLDPNYGSLYKYVNGTLEGTGSTWFWASRDELIQEYFTVTRDYVESDSGSYYYVNHDKAGSDQGRWAVGERKTYYTTNPNEATELTTFEYEPGTYTYAGWYEVLYDANGNEIGEANERYDFSQGVTHNMTLRLRWMRHGAFYISYNPVVTQEGETLTGTINNGDENEVLYVQLDGESYTDNADVVVTRVAKPPEGYEFVGWRIRRDESETIYRVGETFHLLSQYTATVQGKRTVFLDAVYKKVQTTTVVYHANHGTMIANNPNLTSGDVATRAAVYGAYGNDFTTYTSTLVREYYPAETLITPIEGTILLGHILNNSVISLSDYTTWLTAPANATFIGWCENPVFDPEDTEHPLLSNGGQYRVGANAGETEAERVVHLYAIWAVNVAYHLNADTSVANFGGDWTTVLDHNNQSVYTLTDAVTYTQPGVHLDSTLGWPPSDPVYTGSGSQTFLGWATRSGDSAPYTYTLYTFTEPITGVLDLYAQWGPAPTLNVKVVDTTDYPTIVYAPWIAGNTGDATIAPTTAHTHPRTLAAAITTAAQNAHPLYACAFATVEKTSLDMQTIEENPISAIYYSPRDGNFHLVYGDEYNAVYGTTGERDVVLHPTTETLYLLYYKVKDPTIEYVLMETSGFISEITNMPATGIPHKVSDIDTDIFTPNEPVTISSSYTPMTYLANNGNDPDVVRDERTSYTNVNTGVPIATNSITHYNFSIGPAGSVNSSDLLHKSQAYKSTDERPDVLVKNTWRGMRFSINGGTTWFDAGITNASLYVVYYTETPTVITVYNQVVGLRDDMELLFDYDYWIEEITYDSLGNPTAETLVYTTRNPELKTTQAEIDALTDADRHTYHLMNGETFSAFATTTAAHTYRLTCVVKQKDNNQYGSFAVSKKLTHADGREPSSLANEGLPAWADTQTDSERDIKYCYTDADKPYTFSYTVTNNGPFFGNTALLTVTNTRTSVNVDLHASKANLDGSIYHIHDWRAAATASHTVWDKDNAYTVEIPLDQTVSLFNGYTYDIVTPNYDTDYVPGAMIYGYDKHTTQLEQQGISGIDVVTLDTDAPLSCYRIAYEKVYPDNPRSTVYDLYLKDERDDFRYPITDLANQISQNINGVTHPTDQMTFYRLYYLFYPAVRVYYVLENNDGSLTPIRGSLNGTTPSDTITYNGAQATMNGYNGMQATLNSVNVEQGQKVGIWERSLRVCQEVGLDEHGNPYFNIPPLLDMWDDANNRLNRLDLIYYKLGASPQAKDPVTGITPHDDITDFPGNKDNKYLDSNNEIYKSGVTEELILDIGIVDHRLQWQFSDEPGSTVLDNWPVIYAIYRELGYELTVTKKVTHDTGDKEPFPITVTSKSITRDKYSVEGTGYNTISAIPAQLDPNTGDLVEGTGVITFTVKDGDSVTIKGLSAGDDYRITEGRTSNYTLSASYKEAHQENAAVHDFTVTGNVIQEALTLDKNIEVTLVNEPKEICRIGTQKFRTLKSAISYVETLVGSQTATIEMLCDYLMPSSDTPEIPSYLNITLTTANNYVGSGSKATITRDFTSGAMFTNRGTFTLGDVILDGGYVASPESGVSKNAMIENDGTLTFGGPVSCLDITTTTEGGTTTITTQTHNHADSVPVLQNAKNSGNGGAVYGWKGNIEVKNGIFTDCHAARGGAIYVATGNMTVSGGTMQDNTATYGGAICFAGAGRLTVEGGTIGASGHSNTAANGGAIYMASGTADITDGTISYNRAEGLTSGGSTSGGSGGAIYALNAYVNISGGAVSYNQARLNGGAVNMDTLTLTISDAAVIDHNEALLGNGGAICSNTGSVVLEGGTVSDNTAGGNGGGIYLQASAFSMTDGTVTHNTATGNGGGVYAQTGSVSVEKPDGASSTPTITENIAGGNSGSGSGGGIYAGRGAVTMTGASVTKNAANGSYTYNQNSGQTTYTGGAGGGLYVGSGAATLTSCTFGGTSANANTAINGAAVFTDTGTVTLIADTVTYNVASHGGAVGVGTKNAKLVFSGDVVVQNNTMNGNASNVYLDQDTDTVINTNTDGIGGSAYIGIYVPTQNLKVDGETVNLVDRRGVPSAYFGSYVSGGNGDRNVDKFKNDRSPALTVSKDTSGLKLYWSSSFQIEARYLENFTNMVPRYNGSFNGTQKEVAETTYNPPSSRNTASDIAEDLRVNNSSLTNYIFAAALALVDNNGTLSASFDDYITSVNWDIDANCWKFTKRNGSIYTDSQVRKLVVYFSDAYYLTIENNTGATLTITSLEGYLQYATDSSKSFHDLINRPRTPGTGYGYIYALNGAVQETLNPITVDAFDPQDTDLTMRAGDSITILAPGGKGMAYKLTGSFDHTDAALSTYLNALGTGSTTLSISVTADTAFSLGTTYSSQYYTPETDATYKSIYCKFPTGNGGKDAISQLIFGGNKTICRIVTDSVISGATAGTDYERYDAGTGATENKYEYTFSTLQQAVSFINRFSTTSDTIEMTKDYLIPSTDQAVLSAGKDITFSTSVTGTHQYDPGNTDAARRATISRDPKNSTSFIVGNSGAFDTFTLKNLILDGKEHSGGAGGGVVQTTDWKVVVDNCLIKNCVATNGGGLYISYTRTDTSNNAGGTLNVTNTDFVNCKSDGTSRKGGGAIWTDTKYLTVTHCTFTDCFGTDQGGAVFHRIDTSDAASYQHAYAYGSTSTFEDCEFTRCESRTGGAVETDAHIISFTRCDFTDCYSIKAGTKCGSGGAIGTYVYEHAGYVSMDINSSLTVTDCSFRHCTATETDGKVYSGNGGAIRSHAKYTTITGSTFSDCHALRNGGAVAVNNGTATTTTINGCTFSDCSSSVAYGGAIYSDAYRLTFGTAAVNGATVGTSITSCTAALDGGGVYHYRTESTLSATSLSIDRCVATASSSGAEHGGGGLFTNAPTVSMTDCSVTDCTTPKNGGGVHITTSSANATTVTLTNTDLLYNTSKLNGGGLYLNVKKVNNTYNSNNCLTINGKKADGISENKTDGMGGGVYSNIHTVVLKNALVNENQANGNGGGVCQDNTSNNALQGITVDGSTITGNISGGKGGGVYTGSNMTLKGLQTITKTTTGSGESATTTTTTEDKAATVITGNRLKTSVAKDAAGVYLIDGRTLTLDLSDGREYASSNMEEKLNYARITITGNKTVTGGDSNLRLPDKTVSGETVNDNKVRVKCGVQGEIRVVNANKRLTQFGEMVDPTDVEARHGFTDEYKVFWSDDGQLFGIIDRSDSNYTKVIWGGDPICKITDANGRLLYLDANGNTPAVYDMLDNKTNTYDATSAFGTLRSNVTLYRYAPGSNTLVPYDGNEFIIKMLVEEHTMENGALLKKRANFADADQMYVTLTTAKTTDEFYPYRGREGTRCTITRSTLMEDDKAMLFFGDKSQDDKVQNIDLTLQNIVLDGGNVTAKTGTRIIKASSSGSKITLGRDATLQHATVSGDGGAVLLKKGAQLFIDGGAIRNCSATGNGGGVYIDGWDGALTLTAGTITNCTATGNGGGVYFNMGKLATSTYNGVTVYEKGYINMTGGTISRCSAANGGGIYMNSGTISNGTSRNMFMSGGSILLNHATGVGGGIAVGDNYARITFSNAPTVVRNTADTSVANDHASNVHMSQNNLNRRPNALNGTVIVSKGLIRGANIGVYVPGDNNNYPVDKDPNHTAMTDSDFNANATLYDKYGAERDPFASFDGANGDSGMNYFINDRNGMKGGKDVEKVDGDTRIYWRKIYSLTVTKKVLSDAAVDTTKTYYFKLTLTGTSGSEASDVSVIDPNTLAENVDGVYIGGVKFNHGVANFGLHDGETQVFDLLPLGFGYSIEEIMPPNMEQGYFQTSVTYYDANNSVNRTISGRTISNTMSDENHFSYDVIFYNLHAICKITDENGDLLYRESEGVKTPAVYSVLVEAFNRVNGGNTSNWYTIGSDGVAKQVHPTQYRIEMLIDQYTLNPDLEGISEYLTVQQNKNVVLTTARTDAEDGFPYLGANETAEVRLGYGGSDKSMIQVAGDSSLTLENIILDGGSDNSYVSLANGTIIHADNKAELTIGTGATLRNAYTYGDGAAIHLEEGSTLYISGAPQFINNYAQVDLTGEANPANGMDTNFYLNNQAPQDIYLAGYTGKKAESIVVTGDLTNSSLIYVWADGSPHYIQNQQFAVIEGATTYDGLDHFRNAKTDLMTKNPLHGEPKYLYGISRDGMVFWSGSMDLTVIKSVVGGFARRDQVFSFELSVPDLMDGDKLDYAMYKTEDGGLTWTLTTVAPITGNPYQLTVTNSILTFDLMDGEKIVISIPRGMTATVTEVTANIQNLGSVQYQIDDGTEVTGVTASGLVMSVDKTVKFINDFPAISPSGVRFTYVPFLVMVGVGVMLALVVATARKKRREEEE